MIMKVHPNRKKSIPNEVLAKILEEYFIYDEETGFFFFKKRRGRQPAGGRAGWVADRGYIIIDILRHKYRAHRLAWFIKTGSFPEGHIDHVNGVTSDNRWSNLRECNDRLNMQNLAKKSKNNKTGNVGVYFNKRTGKYYSQIIKDGVCYNLGTYSDIQDAIDARLDGRQKYHKFARRLD